MSDGHFDKARFEYEQGEGIRKAKLEAQGLGELPNTGVMGYSLDIVPRDVQIFLKQHKAEIDDADLRLMEKIVELRTANPTWTFSQAMDKAKDWIR